MSESLLGAVYLQHGIEVARAVILKLFGELLDTAPTLGPGWTGRQAFRNSPRRGNLGSSSYVITSTGPDHDKEFTAVVVVMDTEYGSGIGRSKKEAEQRAAAALRGTPWMPELPGSRWCGAGCRSTSKADRSTRWRSCTARGASA